MVCNLLLFCLPGQREMKSALAYVLLDTFTDSLHFRKERCLLHHVSSTFMSSLSLRVCNRKCWRPLLCRIHSCSFVLSPNELIGTSLEKQTQTTISFEPFLVFLRAKSSTWACDGNRFFSYYYGMAASSNYFANARVGVMAHSVIL